jgi:hypothetical protein
VIVPRLKHRFGSLRCCSAEAGEAFGHQQDAQFERFVAIRTRLNLTITVTYRDK